MGRAGYEGIITMGLVPRGKIEVPRLPAGFVSRAGLCADLEEGTDSAVGLVCAPAGYGKTLLLADWARAAAGAADVAWVEVDRDDDDPRRLWAAVTAALAACPSVPAGSGLRAPRPWRPGAQPEFLAELLDDVARLPRPVRLVLDDVHALTDPDTLHGVGILVRNRPEQLRLVLSARSDPPLALPRLRLAGALHELRADRLRLSRAEAADLLVLAGQHLTADQLDLLYTRTGGWAAGLRLAALAVAEAGDVDGLLTRFSGDERSVADYLAGEVLTLVPEELREFLRAASICRPIPAALAAELSGREDAGSLLHELERTALVVRVPDDPHGSDGAEDSYRIQELLRSHLAADLLRRGRRHTEALHGRAARWWAAHDRPIRALDHAALGGAPRLTADLLRRFAVPLFLTGDHRTLRRALSTLPSDDDPWLALASALAHLGAGDGAQARADLRRARLHPSLDDPRLLLLLTATEQLGAGAGPPDHGPPVPDLELPADPAVEALVRLGRGTRILLRRGERTGARRELEAALALGRAHGFDHLVLRCLTLLGVIASAAGDVPAMSALGTETSVAAAEHGWGSSPWSATASAMLAYAALYRCRADEARRFAARGLAASAADPGEPIVPLLAALQTVRGAAEFDGGDRAAGLARMRQARSDLGELAVAPEQAASTAVLEFRAALALGHAVAARTAQGWLAARTSGTAEPVLMRAWTEAAAGRLDQARALLPPLLDGSVPALLAHSPVEAWLLEAAAAVAAGERPAARVALQTALGLAEPLEALRPFAHADPRVRELLAHQHGSFGTAEAFGELALAVGADVGLRRSAGLSGRELTVLALLPSLLSLDEIAADLAVSVNTVKTHVRSIYTKLGVGSRRLAVLAAHEQGLLSGDVRV